MQIFTIFCHLPQGGDAAAALSDTAFYTIYIQSPQQQCSRLDGVCAF